MIKSFRVSLASEQIAIDETIIWIFLETLRKYPPITVLRRVANDDYKIPNTKHVIEKGTIVMVPVYAIHHDPEYFPNPDQYDPDRFSAHEVKKRDPITLLAFGNGPRNCIASRFGMMQTRIGLVKLLMYFEILICQKTETPPVIAPSPIMYVPKNGMYLKLSAIE